MLLEYSQAYQDAHAVKKHCKYAMVYRSAHCFMIGNLFYSCKNIIPKIISL